MTTKRVLASLIPVLSLLCVITVYAGDEFDSVRCGSDIRKALLGRKISNDTVVVAEAKHKDLGLKDLGADEINDHLNQINWLICGEEYVVLEENNIMRDVVKFPKHSKDSPEFSGTCQLNGKDVPGYVIGVLKQEEGAQMLQALSAWKIDEKQKKFVELKTDGLRCSRDGIITADGGR
jgi:hypothetical protein